MEELGVLDFFWRDAAQDEEFARIFEQLTPADFNEDDEDDDCPCIVSSYSAA